MTTLVELWRNAEKGRLTSPAIVDRGRRTTYGECGSRIRALAAALAQRGGIQEGDVVALLAPNCTEFVITYFAVVSLGATVQPIDERLAPDEIEALLADSGAPLLVVHESLFDRVRAAIPRLGSLGTVVGVGVENDGVESFEDWCAFEAEPPQVAVTPDHIAELMYTSGTTGGAKAVMRSHANVLAAARNSIRGFGYEAGDTIAISMPLSHSSALNSQMVPILQLGGTLVLLRAFDVGTVIGLIRSEGVSCMRAVPAMIRLLLTSNEFGEESLPTLRLIINSSAPIDPETYRALKGRFPSVQVMNSYGLTEASTCTVLPDEMALVHPDSVGHPIDGVEMQVIGKGGEPVADGVEGELCIRGDHVFVGYRNRPASERRVTSDGWLMTGDVGYRNDEGLYFLLGRTDDIINSGGRKVVPLEVENCILELPEIREAAVIGAPHRVFGEVVRAVVVPVDEQGFDPKAVVRHCTRRLASHQVPVRVDVVSEIPRNSVGKTLRRELKERFDGQRVSA